MQLRKYNPSLGSNNFPHSEYVPPFYTVCLKILKDFAKVFPNFAFDNTTSKQFYKFLICGLSESPKLQKICPNIDFKCIWKNMYLPCIDPEVRNTMFKLCHDIIYVNYYLFNKHISRDKSCPVCGKTETVAHLFLECSVFLPLNKIVSYILGTISWNKIAFSEKNFRFFELPKLDKFSKYLALVLLSESRHLIWNFRNLKKHVNKDLNSFQIVSKFLNKLKMRILVDKKRLPPDDFNEIWLDKRFCGINVSEDKPTFFDLTKTQFYIEKRIVKF